MPTTFDPATFDHQSTVLAQDPSETWRQLRAIERIPRSDAHGGFHIVARYDEVCDVARRPQESPAPWWASRGWSSTCSR